MHLTGEIFVKLAHMNENEISFVFFPSYIYSFYRFSVSYQLKYIRIDLI